jgi:hypothetical protein
MSIMQADVQVNHQSFMPSTTSTLIMVMAAK